MKIKVKFDCEAVIECSEPLTKKEVGLALENLQDEPIGKFVKQIGLVVIDMPAQNPIVAKPEEVVDTYLKIYKRSKENVQLPKRD